MNHMVFIWHKSNFKCEQIYFRISSNFLFLEMGVALGEHFFPLQVGHLWSALHIIKLVFSLKT